MEQLAREVCLTAHPCRVPWSLCIWLQLEDEKADLCETVEELRTVAGGLRTELARSKNEIKRCAADRLLLEGLLDEERRKNAAKTAEIAQLKALSRRASEEAEAVHIRLAATPQQMVQWPMPHFVSFASSIRYANSSCITALQLRLQQGLDDAEKTRIANERQLRDLRTSALSSHFLTAMVRASKPRRRCVC